MTKRFGTADKWFTGALALLALGVGGSLVPVVPFLPASLVTTVIAPWVGFGLIVLAVMLAVAGLAVWRYNVRHDKPKKIPAEKKKEKVAATRPIRPALTEHFAALAIENPLSAILQAYLAIEAWYDRELEEHGLDKYGGTGKRSVREMSRLAVEHGFLPTDTVPLIDGLGYLRDTYKEKGGDAVTSDEARTYLLSAEGALLSLDHQVKRAKSQP